MNDPVRVDDVQRPLARALGRPVYLVGARNAEQLANYIDEIRARYPAVEVA